MNLIYRFLNGCIKLVNDILTGKDNRTYDSGRVWMAVSFIYYYHLSEVAARMGHPWSSTDYATGISVIAVAFSMNMRIKDTTEPIEFIRKDQIP